jgi:hypothetical protein
MRADESAPGAPLGGMAKWLVGGAVVGVVVATAASVVLAPAADDGSNRPLGRAEDGTKLLEVFYCTS